MNNRCFRTRNTPFFGHSIEESPFFIYIKANFGNSVLMKWNDEMMKWWMKWSKFWVFDFYETFICYRGVLRLNCYIGKKVQKNFLMGLKIWWSWGSGIFFFKITAGRTVFRKSTPNFTITNGDFWSNFEVLKKKKSKSL